MEDTRTRLVTAMAELFRRQGFNGTSLKQVINAAGVPFGSLYHFFPGGKEQLAEATIRSSGTAYQQLCEAIYDAAADPGSAITDLFDGAAEVLEQSGYADACPIGTVALEVASTNARLRQTTADVFGDWCESIATRLGRAGIDPPVAQELATVIVAAIEGGFMLSRTARSPEPMQITGRFMRGLVETALTERARR